MSKPQKDGYRGMMEVYRVLRARGRKVEVAGYYAPFDLMVDGKIRLEIKTCASVKSKDGRPVWRFNIQRHGKINEETDFYILRLENVPFTKKKAIHLLLRAPLKVPSISIEPMTLMTRYAKYSESFQEFCKIKSS